MPPTRHSTSTAHKESNQIPSDQNYPLGDYSFRIERTSVPGSTNDKIEAICTDKDGKNARKSIQIPSSTQLDGWYVEANETEATVYAIERIPIGDSDEHTSDFGQGPWPQPVVSAGSVVEWDSPSRANESNGGVFAYLVWEGSSQIDTLCSSTSSEATYRIKREGRWEDWVRLGRKSSFTYDGKTVYYDNPTFFGRDRPLAPLNVRVSGSNLNAAKAAWTIWYGTPVSPTEYETKQVIVGRFAIDLEDAGGVGPGSDWIDPGDYDPDWEEGDPTHTLYVTVTGALSGRHNDPIEDPSYSYIPADKDTVKDYGCGGDGGHGGGGGAGASTVVVHKFATNQANSKEVTAIARRHGYGSGGGKGGKGGDGCILVYYCG